MWSADLQKSPHLMILLQSKFHSPQCYDVGPYATAKDYALAYYDKEIYYYTHQPEDNTDWLLFEKESWMYQDDDGIPDVFRREELLENKASFIEELKCTRDRLAAADDIFTPEPFVLVHGDLQGRNMIARDGHLASMSDPLTPYLIKAEAVIFQASSTGNLRTLSLL